MCKLYKTNKKLLKVHKNVIKISDWAVKEISYLMINEVIIQYDKDDYITKFCQKKFLSPKVEEEFCLFIRSNIPMLKGMRRIKMQTPLKTDGPNS